MCRKDKMVTVHCNRDTSQTIRESCQDRDSSFISGHPAPGALPGPLQKFSRCLAKEGADESGHHNAAVVFACLKEDTAGVTTQGHLGGSVG